MGYKPRKGKKTEQHGYYLYKTFLSIPPSTCSLLSDPIFLCASTVAGMYFCHDTSHRCLTLSLPYITVRPLRARAVFEGGWERKKCLQRFVCERMNIREEVSAGKIDLEVAVIPGDHMELE